MTVYEIPSIFQFSEEFNSHNGFFFSTLLGTKKDYGIWAIYSLDKPDSPLISDFVPYSPKEINSDISVLGYKRTFLTTRNINQVEEYLLLQKEKLNTVN